MKPLLEIAKLWNAVTILGLRGDSVLPLALPLTFISQDSLMSPEKLDSQNKASEETRYENENCCEEMQKLGDNYLASSIKQTKNPNSTTLE